jgi:hypothetical protein
MLSPPESEGGNEEPKSEGEYLPDAMRLWPNPEGT